MSLRGICSRREADVYIKKGCVFVDGEKITTLGTKVSPQSKITLIAREKKISIALFKPLGYVSTQPEKGYLTAVDLLPKKHHRKLSPCGRLDIDSQGLLLFSQDGRVAKAIIGETTEMEKEYIVTFTTNPSEEQLEKLRFGILLEEKQLKPAKIKPINKSQISMTLTEGKNRQIRRMARVVGLTVKGIKRMRIGPIDLGTLKSGEWRYLENDELIKLAPSLREDQ